MAEQNELTVAQTPRHYHRPWWIIPTAVVAAIVLLAVFWDWDWFRPMVERKASAELGRKVTIGHFDVQHIWSLSPDIIADDIVVANPDDFGEPSQLGSIGRVAVNWQISPYFLGPAKHLELPSIEIDRPAGDLRRGPAGDPNWRFILPAGQGGTPPHIGVLIIKDGDFRVNDPQLKADLHVLVHTAAPIAGSEQKLIATATGTYAGAPITAKFIGGTILALRDPAHPYPINFTASNGGTHISLVGTVRDPLKLAGADLELELAGRDLSDLYAILGIPLAHTPAYRLSGHLDYADKAFRFKNFAGVVGQSDVEGDFAVTPGEQRPLIRADLRSRQVVMSDLAGFIGGAPGTGATAESSAVREQHQESQESRNLFPDIPVSVPRIRAADFDLRYTGQHFVNKSIPLDNISAVITIRQGVVRVHPITFGVGTGSIAANIALDARGDEPHLTSDIDFRRVDFHRLMQSTKIFQGTGVIGGRAQIDGSGKSLAQVMAAGNGGLKLYMTGGDVSNLIVDLAGLDFGRSILSLLGIPEKTNIRCMITDFGLRDGIVSTNQLVLDTGEADIIGKGSINLRNETINYQISQDPKHLSIAALHAPIEITGLLKKPSISVEPKTLAERAGAAVVLGFVIPGLGALIPTVQLGLGTDNDCYRLIAPAVAAQNGKKPLK